MNTTHTTNHRITTQNHNIILAALQLAIVAAPPRHQTAPDVRAWELERRAS